MTILNMATRNLQDDLDSLNAAIVSGERQVVIGNESVLYNTTESLIKARNDVQTRLNAQKTRAGGRRRGRQNVWTYGGRGYNE